MTSENRAMSEVHSPNFYKAASRYGVYLGLLLILMQTIQYLAGIYVSSVFSILTGSLFIAGVVLVIRDFREKEMNGWLSFGEGVKIGSISSLGAGFLFGGFMLVLTLFIDPGFIDDTILQSIEMLESNNIKLPEDELDRIIENLEKTTAWDFAYAPVLQFGLSGLLISLIASIFLRKSPDSTFEKDTL